MTAALRKALADHDGNVIDRQRYFLARQMDAEIDRVELNTGRIRRLLEFAEPFRTARRERIEARLREVERDGAEGMPSDNPMPDGAA